MVRNYKEFSYKRKADQNIEYVITYRDIVKRIDVNLCIYNGEIYLYSNTFRKISKPVIIHNLMIMIYEKIERFKHIKRRKNRKLPW
jgi:hypothetical protein